MTTTPAPATNLRNAPYDVEAVRREFPTLHQMASGNG